MNNRWKDDEKTSMNEWVSVHTYVLRDDEGGDRLENLNLGTWD